MFHYWWVLEFTWGKYRQEKEWRSSCVGCLFHGSHSSSAKKSHAMHSGSGSLCFKRRCVALPPPLHKVEMWLLYANQGRLAKHILLSYFWNINKSLFAFFGPVWNPRAAVHQWPVCPIRCSQDVFYMVTGGCGLFLSSMRNCPGDKCRSCEHLLYLDKDKYRKCEVRRGNFQPKTGSD